MKMKRVLKRIHCAAPVRICDVGGWTDTWFARHGAVFNIAVTPYVEVDITTYKQETEERVTLHLENYNDTYSLTPGKIVYGKHPLIEAAIDTIGIPPDISLDIKIFSKVPAGASVGTSAAVCVALICALDTLTPGRLTPHELAALAHRVETEKLGLQSGVQDQLCSAYGGINFIHIHSFPHSNVTPVNAAEDLRQDLEKRLALIYIGTPHNSSEVHKKVIADLGENAEKDPRIQELRELAVEARNAVNSGNLEALGEVMNRNTKMQRQLHPDLVGEKFAEIIEIANFFRVSGCKVNGAGGDGGSVTILGDGDTEKKKKLLHTLENKGYDSIPVSLSPNGVHVLPPAARGALFEKTAPLDPPQKLFIKGE
ncbi:MAG: GHMP kinase [Candidatus Aminicenantes bacterium]|nr:MAG: GHMP kinase [Candidatus Aminicenantes bacterium]